MLVAQDLSHSFGNKELFVNISLSLSDSQRLALVGENGAGKSTLLKILAREIEADTGKISLSNHETLGYLSQNPKLDPESTVYESVRTALKNLISIIAQHQSLCTELASVGAKHRDLEKRIGDLSLQIEELGGFNIESRISHAISRYKAPAKDRVIKTLSGGEKRRVDLARLMLSAPDIYLLDEPTNHLDVQTIAFLSDSLKKSGKPVLFISHDRGFINEVATRIIELDRGKLYSHDMPYSNFVENKVTRSEIHARTAHRKERLMARELVWLRASPSARTTKAKARVQAGHALIEDVQNEMQATKERRAQIESAKTNRLAKTVLELDNVGFSFGEKKLFSALSLKLVKGDCYGIVGANGSGKTTLLSLLMGTMEPTEGSIKKGPHTKVAIFDQLRAGLNPEASLKETLANDSDHVHVGDNKIHIASYLERFLFSPSDINRKVVTLSGGEQNRLLLAVLFKTGANLLLLDEPTNDLDITTLGVLEEAIHKHEGVSFVVSHDKEFLDRVCTGIIAFDDPIAVYQGNYSTYQRLKPTQEKVETEGTSAKTFRSPKTKTKRSFNEEREYKKILEVIEQKEEELANHDAELANPTLFKDDPSRAQELIKMAETLREEIPQLYERWQQLDEMGS